jgi:hypothetical protein
MSNMIDVTKMKVSLLLPIRLVRKIDRAANSGVVPLSRNEIVNAVLSRELAFVELDDEDLEWCNSQIRKNRDARNKA